jgi:hypothetical protein
LDDTDDVAYEAFKWEQHRFQFFINTSNLLFNINSLLNPIIYFMFTRQFADFWYSHRGALQMLKLRTHNAADLAKLGGIVGLFMYTYTV